MYWEKYSYSTIKQLVFQAIGDNINYRKAPVLGLPATYLDEEIFYPDAPFLKDAPFITALIENPNHIGCHTLEGEHEAAFKGTQELEREVIAICAEQIFGGEKGQQDGYVASGGSEANIQALWMYRNYFMNTYGLTPQQIGVVYSEDTHYSIPKGINILSLNPSRVSANRHTRLMESSSLETQIDNALSNGIQHFIVVLNMGTTMFGTVDDLDTVVAALSRKGVSFKIHVDAAFGGFVYPFLNTSSAFTFKNHHISSFTIDGHKLLQAPYGTGIFITRKGLLENVCTQEAQYVSGLDYTLCGSRSGANAIAVWMILRYYGSEGWRSKMKMLNDRTDRICQRLNEMNVYYIRNPFVNIITMKAHHISPQLAQQYCLVPDNHQQPNWYKIVVMPHVKQGIIDQFLEDLRDKMRIVYE